MSADESEEKKEGGFTIKDSRSSKMSEEEVQEKTQEQADSKTAASQTQSASANMPPLEIDFSTFVLSLTSSAFYHLGDIADPQTGETRVELPAVKQTIDILIMLQGKTKGNLNPEESKLLEQLIYELQMKYLAKSK